jgi:hypothetical protein
VRIQRTGTAVSVAQFPGNTFTVEEVDGDPSGAVNKLVVSNGALSISGNTATITTGGGAFTDLSDTPGTLGTVGQVVAVASGGTTLEFVDQSGADVQYHDRYSTEAESERSGATATLEIYYTARPDGDGYAESEVSDIGETDTINRTLYYSTKFQADPDTAGDWTEYTTQPANNATFATAKAALLAGLNETDATAETRGTLPLSLKMVRTTTAAATDLLLDSYPNAAAAFSIRKLDKDYTGYCMRVREDSGDTEADIGFDGSGGVDQSAIATHCGSANGYVVTWYDQSGNGNNATQSTAGNQPQIYNGTAVITENGKPIIKSNDITDGFSSIAVDMSGSTISMTSVSRSENPNYSVLCYLIPPIDERMMLGQNGSALTDGGQKGFTTSGAELFWNSSSQGTSATRGEVFTQFYQNQTLATWVGLTAVNGTAIYLSSAQSFWQMHSMQEIIFWESDQSTNRTGIETDINTYFSIYP